MPNFNDIFADFGNTLRQGIFSNTNQQAQMIRARAAITDPNSNAAVIDPVIDKIWGGDVGTQAPHSYFDYYFSGQDVRIWVDGTDNQPDFNVLPIMSFAFSIQQQKQPVYGFWSFTYDAVMRGSRLINGQFTIATKSVDYMRRLLSAAAQARSNSQQSYTYFKGLTDDDKNIQQFWGQNIDPAIQSSGKQIFSIHPPFSFVIVYGIQSASVNPSNPGQQAAVLQAYNDDNPLLADTNERLVESDPVNQLNRLVLDACELTEMQTGYGPDGAVVFETYSFFARDIVIPSQGVGTRGQQAAPTGGPFRLR